MMIQEGFTWDNAGPEATFTGWHDPLVNWNGWACPYFERSEVDRIIAYDQQLPNNPNKWEWHGDDLHWFENSNDHAELPEIITPTYYNDKKLWAIGAWYWTWDVVSDEERLAFQFAKVLKEWLKPEQITEVIKRNTLEKYQGCCATHDFCDANMAMAEAFKRTFNREFEFGNELDSTLFNGAWYIAKQNQFYTV